MSFLKDLIINLKSSIIIHDNWQFRGLPLLTHFANFSPGIKISFISKGSFFRTTIPTHDDYEKTIGDIEKQFFAFSCQLKKLNADFFWTTSSPVTGYLLYFSIS
jgi:hypothetical protein